MVGPNSDEGGGENFTEKCFIGHRKDGKGERPTFRWKISVTSVTGDRDDRVGRWKM
jgi:hypothetical protein